MRDRWQTSRAEFERLVEEALAGLPEEFSQHLQNIVVSVEDEPTDDDLDVLDDEEDEDAGDELLGIYRGVPRTDRSWDQLAQLPDLIAIFRGPILRVVESREEAIREIRETVIHEIGHYFGLEDDEMPF
jgi:predicted Zn-dependent protease with MMP-like domain